MSFLAVLHFDRSAAIVLENLGVHVGPRCLLTVSLDVGRQITND